MLNSGSTYTEEFPADATSVPKARAAVAGFALAAGANSNRLEAIRLAISEAATNAVLHAFKDGGGSFLVTASFMPGELWLLVADDGGGMQPGGTPGGLGVGLAIIAQLADNLEIVKRASGGTEIQMRFKLEVAGEAPEAKPSRRRLTTA